MRSIRFSKRCDADGLTQELRQAGLDILGVTTTSEATIIHLPDTEKVDTNRLEQIVEAHDPDLYIHQRKVGQIDRETGNLINLAVHRVCPLEEQIGILRDQLVHVLNALGIEPTKEFARLNEIAIKEIEAARAKKEAENAQDDTA